MEISNDAQAVIFRLNKALNKYEFLVLFRFDKEKNKNHCRLIKGGVKKGEAPKDAVIREVEEEVGIKGVSITANIHQYDYVAGGVLHKVLVFLIDASAINFDLRISSSGEGGFTIKSIKWLDKENALKQLNFLDEKKVINIASIYLKKKA